MIAEPESLELLRATKAGAGGRGRRRRTDAEEASSEALQAPEIRIVDRMTALEQTPHKESVEQKLEVQSLNKIFMFEPRVSAIAALVTASSLFLSFKTASVNCKR